MVSLHLILKSIRCQLFLHRNTSGIVDEDIESRLVIQNLRSELANGPERGQIKVTDNHVIVTRLLNNVICERTSKSNVYYNDSRSVAFITFGSQRFLSISTSENDTSASLCQVDGRFLADSRIGSGDDNRFVR